MGKFHEGEFVGECGMDGLLGRFNDGEFVMYIFVGVVRLAKIMRIAGKRDTIAILKRLVKRMMQPASRSSVTEERGMFIDETGMGGLLGKLPAECGMSVG